MASSTPSEESSSNDLNNETILRNQDKANVYPVEELNEPLVDSNKNNIISKMQNTTTIKAVPQMRETLNIGSGILTNQSFISDRELKMLLTDALDGFLFIARCDIGTILYVNDTVLKILNIRQDEWLAANFFQQVHPADVGKVKEQLNNFKSIISEDDCSDDEKKIFNCRMRLKAGSITRGKFKNFLNSKQNQCYTLVQCKGFVRKLPGNQEVNASSHDEQYCLVATAKLHVASVPNNTDLDAVVQQFSSRHSCNGNFIFVDQRITNALGYTTGELLGKCFFNFFYRDDKRFIKETFKFIPSLKGKSMTVTYRFWSKSGFWVWLRINIYAFVNPYSNEIDYIICDCTVLPHDVGDSNDTGLQYFNMALANRSTSNYRQKDRFTHLNCSSFHPQQNDLLNDSQAFLLSDTALTNDLFNPGPTTTAAADWSQFTSAIPSLNEWTLPAAQMEMFQQQDWPIIPANWPLTNDTNNDLNQLYQDQSDIWQFNDDNSLWPNKLFENNNTLQQYQDFNQRSKTNWIDKDNFENFTSLPYTAFRQNQIFGEFSGNQNTSTTSSINQQRLWQDNDWLQNDLLTKSFNDLAITQSLTKPNFPWKTNREDNIFQLSLPQQYLSVDATCKSILQSAATGDQSKLTKLPDLIEQVLHVDQPFKQTD